MKRIVRELRGDWRKYLVVGLFLILTIGFVSGMYVANESMMKAADEGISKYKLEDGHFELDHKADAICWRKSRPGYMKIFTEMRKKTIIMTVRLMGPFGFLKRQRM